MVEKNKLRVADHILCPDMGLLGLNIFFIIFYTLPPFHLYFLEDYIRNSGDGYWFLVWIK